MASPLKIIPRLRERVQARRDLVRAQRHISEMGYDRPREERAEKARQVARAGLVPIRRAAVH